jgi:hypothetical protein
MTENTKKVIGNLVIPDTPIPSQVRMSMLPIPPIPVEKVVDGQEAEAEPMNLVDTAPNLEEVSVGEVDARPKGTITIKVFENSPYEVEFEGVVTGSEIDIAWKAMMKEYRVWKHNLFKKETEQKSGGM